MENLNQTKYTLNLTCNYKEFIDWVNHKFPSAIVNEKGNTFEITLPSENFTEQIRQILPEIETKKAVRLLHFSSLRFDILNRSPLALNCISYWLIKESQDVQDFIALANNYFGQVIQTPRSTADNTDGAISYRSNEKTIENDPGGTLNYVTNEQGQTTIGGTLNKGYTAIIGNRLTAIIPEGAFLVHTGDEFITTPADPVLQMTSPAQVEPPAPPLPGAHLSAHFDWYYKMRQSKYRVSLKDVSQNANLGYDYVRHEHRKYKSEHGID